MQGLRAFQRYFDFSGRSGRAEYWQFLGIFTAAAVVAVVLDIAMGNTQPVLLYLISAALVVPYYSVSVRRLHDRALSAKVLFIQLGLLISTYIFPYEAGRNAYTTAGDVWAGSMHVANAALLATNIGLIILTLGRGTTGANRYGPDPSDIEGPPPSVRELVSRVQTVVSAQAQAQDCTATASRAAPVRAAELDPLDQIKRLAELRDTGALTEAEFTERKAALLNRL